MFGDRFTGTPEIGLGLSEAGPRLQPGLAPELPFAVRLPGRLVSDN